MMSAASISQTFDFGGPSFTIDAACSSALVAIHEASVNLRAKQCNVAFAGAVPGLQAYARPSGQTRRQAMSRS